MGIVRIAAGEAVEANGRLNGWFRGRREPTRAVRE
jgi:hypothetical protein